MSPGDHLLHGRPTVFPGNALTVFSAMSATPGRSAPGPDEELTLLRDPVVLRDRVCLAQRHLFRHLNVADVPEDNHETREQPVTPILVTPEPTELVVASDGLFMHELVNTTADGNAPGAPNSVAWTLLGPGERTSSCRSDTSWTYLTVLRTGHEGLHTEGGPRMDQRRVQHAHQVLVIPPGYPHRFWNPSLTAQATAIEVRSCPSVFDDRILLPQLDQLGLNDAEDTDVRRGEVDALLLTPDPDKLMLAAHGLLMHELVNATPDGNAPNSPNSVAWVRLEPGERTHSHRHDESTAYVIVLETGLEGADTEGGPRMTDRYTQHPAQVLVIPPGYEHRAYNPDLVERVTAIEIRSCPSVYDDRRLLPNLDHLGLDPLGDHRVATAAHRFAPRAALASTPARSTPDTSETDR